MAILGNVFHFTGVEVFGKAGEHRTVNLCDVNGGSMSGKLFANERTIELIKTVDSLPRFCQVRASFDAKAEGKLYNLFLVSLQKVDEKGEGKGANGK